VTTAYTLLTTALVIAVAVAVCVRPILSPYFARFSGLLIAVACNFPPLDEFTSAIVTSLLHPYAPGVLLGACWFIVRPFVSPLVHPSRSLGAGEALFFFVLMIAFYASSLGATRFDAYSLFYDPAGAVLLTGSVLTAGALFRRLTVVALAPIALTTWYTGLNGSENASDAVFHPALLIGVVATLALKVTKTQPEQL
jgi:hypothetical protein